MPDSNSENIGGINVDLTADIQSMLDKFAETYAAAKQTADNISAAFAAGSSFAEPVEESLDDIRAQLEANNAEWGINTQAMSQSALAAQNAANMQTGLNVQLGVTAGALNTAYTGFVQQAQAMQQGTGNAQQLVNALQNLQQAQVAFAQAQAQATGTQQTFTAGVQGLGQQLVALGALTAVTAGMKAFAEAALEAYADEQTATVGLTALMGSATLATAALQDLKAMALDEALSFPQLRTAYTRLVAFGVQAQEIPKVLQAAADSAAVMETSMETAAQSITRIGESGMVSARFLVSLGLTTEDLGRVMNATGDDIKQAFKDETVDERIATLTTALQKFGGAAQAQADTITGKWRELQTEWLLALQKMGAALAPVASQILDFANGQVIPAITSIFDAFNSLPGPVKEIVVVVAGLTAAAVPLAVGVGGVAVAVGALTAAFVALGIAIAPIALGVAALAAIAIEAVVQINQFSDGINTLRTSADLLDEEFTDFAPHIQTVSDAIGSVDPVLGGLVQNLLDAAEKMQIFGASARYVASATADTLAPALAKLDAAARKLADPLTAEKKALDDVLGGLKADTSAHQLAADMTGAHSELVRELNNDLKNAQAELDVTRQKMQAGYATGQDYANALGDVEKAQKALTAATTSAVPVIDKHAQKVAEFRQILEHLADEYAYYDPTLSNSTALADANAQVVYGQGQRVAELRVALNELESSQKTGVDVGDSLAKVYANLTAAYTTWINNIANGAPDVSKDFEVIKANIDATTKALSALPSELPGLAAYHPTLEQIDADWAKQSNHINKLAKYDMPEAIKAYQDYINKLEDVNAPLGQIYAAQEKLDQIQIASAEQSGTDATAQIIDLVNLKEKTEALATAADGLGNIYKGLAKTFDDTFNELGTQLVSAMTGAESFGAAFHKVILKIASDILTTLVDGALQQLKAAIVGALGGLSGGGGGVLGTAIGAVTGGKGGAAGGATGGATAAAQQAQMTASVTQFHTAVTQFNLAATQFHTTVTQFNLAVGQFGASNTTFDASVTFFDETTALFDETCATFDESCVFFDESTGFFDESTATFDASTISFDGSVIAFTAAVTAFTAATAASATSSLGGLFGGLLSIFAFKGGGEVGNVPILSYLHPKEMVLPSQYADVIRGLAGNGGGGLVTNVVGIASGASNAQGSGAQVVFNNTQLHGVSSSTLNELGTQIVEKIRRSGARF